MSDAILEYLKSIDERLGTLNEDMKDGFATMNGRVRTTEEFQAKQKGVLAAAGILITFFSGIASWLFGSHQ